MPFAKTSLAVNDDSASETTASLPKDVLKWLMVLVEMDEWVEWQDEKQSTR